MIENLCREGSILLNTKYALEVLFKNVQKVNSEKTKYFEKKRFLMKFSYAFNFELFKTYLTTNFSLKLRLKFYNTTTLV